LRSDAASHLKYKNNNTRLNITKPCRQCSICKIPQRWLGALYSPLSRVPLLSSSVPFVP
jgi:hypothetical protein